MKRLTLLLVIVACALCVSPITHAMAAPSQSKIKVQWLTFSQTNSKKVSSEVKAIQFLLRFRGFYKAQPDGIFGPQTVAAVKNFQRAKGLKVDGVVGPETFPKLVQTVKRGDRGDAVRAAQLLGREATDHIGGQSYTGLKVDGVYGKATEEAIYYFQNAVVYPSQDPNPNANGKTDKMTWKLMFGEQL